ncbi:MAG: hypothetical protein AAB391_01130 [Patescibacteria group bacterium]
MKNLLFATLWLTVAVVSYVLGQPMITLAIAILAATEIWAQFRTRRGTSSAPRQSTISQALATGTTGSHRHDWFALR